MLYTFTFCDLLGDPSVDVNHQAMQNDYGLVRHAVLEKPDHTTVHVIYGHTSRDFVLSELTERPREQSGLQLIPSEKHAAVLSSERCIAVDCIIVFDTDYDICTLLSEMVKFAGYPDIWTLFLQTEKTLPWWLVEELPKCTVIWYPDSAEERTQFWDKLTMLIGV